MKEFVQNILIYVIIIAVLRGLINGPKFQQYFQFFSGVVLILLFLTPMLSFFQGERDWFHIMEEKFLQMDLDDIKGEMKVAEEGFEEILCKRYEEVVKEQVELLAQEKGVELEDTYVALKRQEDTWEVAEVSGRIAGEEEAGEALSKAAVETVTIGEEPIREEQEDTSKKGKELKKQICSSFTLGKEQVHLWK